MSRDSWNPSDARANHSRFVLLCCARGRGSRNGRITIHNEARLPILPGVVLEDLVRR